MPPSPSDSVSLSRRMVMIAIVSLTLPWVALVAVLGLMPTRNPNAENSDPVEARTGDVPTEVSVGEWGQLELSTVVIEPPDDLISVEAQRVEHVLWHFVGYSETQIESLWDQASLTPEQRKTLSDRDRWIPENDRIKVRVSKSLVLSLAPESRRIMYAALSPFRENGGQWSPASFRAESAEDWFANSELNEDTVSLIQPLLYRRGKSLLFSDLDLVLADVKTHRQRLLLMRTLARSTTQLARLRLNAQTDVAAVAQYWSLGQRNRDIEPLLKSVAQRGGDSTLDLIHLLPPVARRLVYTYDSPPPGEDAFRDCHWTALNFANKEADDRYRNLDDVRSAYRNDYIPVTDKPQLGDIFLFVIEGDIVLHASVHVAGDLVFTKNGSWAAAPWVLMRMPDLMALYPSDEPLDIRHLRAKR